MRNKNIKKIVSIFLVLITVLFFSFQVSAQNVSSTDNSPTTKLDVFVQVNVLSTYCDGGVGFGKVDFKTEPYDGATFQVSGKYSSGDSIMYTFHPGEHKLPVGVYTWNAIPVLSTVGNPELPTGEFIIQIECGDSSNDTVDNPDNTVDNPDDTIDNGMTFSDGDSDTTTDENTDTGTATASAVNVSEEEGPKTSPKRPQEDGDSSGEQLPSIDEEVAGTTSSISDEAETESAAGISDEGETKPAVATGGDSSVGDTSIIRSILNGTHVLFLETQYADLIEWYIKREPGGIYKYLGAAIFNKESGRWEYVWDTTQVPNGDYVLVPKIKSDSGKVYKHTPSHITVKNEKVDDSTSTEDTTFVVNEAKEAASQVAVIEKEEEEQAKENIIGVTTPYYDKGQKYLENNQDGTVQKRKFIEKQRKEEAYLKRLLDIESSKLLGSMLDGDEDRKKRIREKIIMASDDSFLRIDKFARELGIELDKEEIKLIQEEKRVLLAEFERIIEKKKEALHGHVEENIFNDSDKDGISDYDEINTYDTNPLNADSDNDGYIDGAEILGGFNPKDASVEAVIHREEPTTAGYVEEEMISIDSVSTAEVKIDEDGEEKVKTISFQGTAPPNSFVTLYIYSTPIIVTVKTDSRGNWNYVLDKELEDGNHEIYVAITDNAGKIFAKSKPLPFVKEAAAVTINENALLGGDDTSLSIFDRRYLYITVLLIVVIIGWVLIFTGSKRTALEEHIDE